MTLTATIPIGPYNLPRISKIKGKPIPPPVSGEKRCWKRCRKCGWTGYQDYVPFSLGGRFSIMGGGHDMADRSVSETITEAEAVSAINSYLSSQLPPPGSEP